ncbi:MAG: hypothetical protein D6728_06625 [Cyanobacteria bacterium J055]|nr:MAG: hypothetical protein D6728_06625 [Cyanobacteria bacterium J055]
MESSAFCYIIIALCADEVIVKNNLARASEVFISSLNSIPRTPRSDILSSNFSTEPIPRLRVWHPPNSTRFCSKPLNGAISTKFGHYSIAVLR